MIFHYFVSMQINVIYGIIRSNNIRFISTFTYNNAGLT